MVSPTDISTRPLQRLRKEPICLSMDAEGNLNFALSNCPMYIFLSEVSRHFFSRAVDESKVLWYSGKKEKHVKLSEVCKIIPGQRTEPENAQGIQAHYEASNSLGKAFADIITHTASVKSVGQPNLVDLGLVSPGSVETSNSRSSGADAIRTSLSSVVSSSSQSSSRSGPDAFSDVFIWGQGIGNGVLGGGTDKIENSFNTKMDALLPKELVSKVVLDVNNIACGGRHAALVTKQGNIFSWGEESGGRLGHGVETDVLDSSS
ncbi:hypothetical protein F3Y22_tig00112383pilonHSYRG00124 [Hibiscus syriacus]|uniref:Uncharacterized protein n=1 Tax=Hibiscus syriacus TaxID=106335 RepID=A0A6A2WZJ0_HIBSY|nr:hypothetical protein F3Y22_tig00112383pilonHSYRG00124 [Hibiscus syriacus]